MRILITEEALQSGEGHWPGYIGTIADGLRATGDEVDILIHKEANPKLAESLQATPWFSRNCWRDPRSQGGIGGLKHNYLFGRELKSWLKQSEKPYDWICALTMRLQHLPAFAALAHSRAVSPSTRFLLLFVNGFGVFHGPGDIRFPKNLSTLLARLSFRMMSGAVRSGRVVISAETKGMQSELQEFTGLPVALFPHPVPCHEENFRSVTNPDTSGAITFTCPGFARHEKGNDLLHDAIRLLLEDEACKDFCFVMQWPDKIGMPDGSQMGPDVALAEHPQVRFVNESLSPGDYEQLLLESDVIVLPYRRSSYHNRVSRVAIEAASRGIPLVYMEGTWSREVVEQAGAGIPIENEIPEAVADAIRLAAGSIDRLRTGAQAGAPRIREYYSVDTFRHQLMERLSA